MKQNMRLQDLILALIFFLILFIPTPLLIMHRLLPTPDHKQKYSECEFRRGKYLICRNLLINSGFQVDLHFFRIKPLLLRMFHAEALDCQR